jgi:hypothetical protein
MRTHQEIEADPLNRARLFVYRAKSLAAGSDSFERKEFFHATLPPHFKSLVPGATFDPLTPMSFGKEFLALSKRSRILPQLVGKVDLIPFVGTPVVSTTGGVTFTAEGSPLPAQRFDTDPVYGRPARLGVIAVLTKELARSSDEKAVSTCERVLNQTLVHAENAMFVSDIARVAGITPGGILAGVTAGSGSPDDVWSLWDQVSGGSPMKPYFITSSRAAMFLLTGATPGSIFSTLDATLGGSIGGVPVILSAEAGNKLILLDAAMLGAVDGDLDVKASESGAIQMDDDPLAPSALVSLWQSNSIALRLVRNLDYLLATDDAVAFVEVAISGSPA